MKRIVALALVMVMCLGLAAPAWAAEVPVYVDGKAAACGIWQGESIYVPLRSVGEHCGAKVAYDQVRQVVLVNRVDGGYLELGVVGNDPAAVFKQGITYVPLRFVGEWLNYQVDYQGDQVRLTKLAAAPYVDSVALPAGNLNCNLLNNKYSIFWQDNIYYWCSFSDTLNRVNGGETQTEVAGGSYQSFNIWQGELYAVYDGKEPYHGYSFYKLNPETFLPQEKILAGPLQYCKIQDGWIYFQRDEYGELYRRQLAGGEVETLGFGNAAEVIITDQHIFANLKALGSCQLWQANLDGSNPKLIAAFANRRVQLLDYADGRFYLTQDDNAAATIWTMRQDGADFKKLSLDGAGEACIFDGYLYYSRLEPLYYSDVDGFANLSGRTVCRIPVAGGAVEQVSPTATEGLSGYDQPIIWNGRIFYREFANMSWQYWHEVK